VNFPAILCHDCRADPGTKALIIAAHDSVVACFLTNAKTDDLTQAVTYADVEPPVSYIVCIS
jgi:hypothetical protein